MGYCTNCDAIQPPSVAGYCGLCGKLTVVQKSISMKKLQEQQKKKGVRII
jgi:hypothetical protein